MWDHVGCTTGTCEKMRQLCVPERSFTPILRATLVIWKINQKRSERTPLLEYDSINGACWRRRKCSGDMRTWSLCLYSSKDKMFSSYMFSSYISSQRGINQVRGEWGETMDNVWRQFNSEKWIDQNSHRSDSNLTFSHYTISGWRDSRMRNAFRDMNYTWGFWTSGACCTWNGRKVIC